MKRVMIVLTFLSVFNTAVFAQTGHEDISDGKVEVAAIDPLASMQAVEKSAFMAIAAEISNKLKKVIDGV